MRRDPDAPVYVISVAAKLTGLPAWLLRLLDQEGIVVPTRTEKNRRLYSDNDVARLQRIRYLTEERGVNVAGVKVILEMEERGYRMVDEPEMRETLVPQQERDNYTQEEGSER
jgi:MerR family transcriptional regulator/heat shock protein HspR